ncbi:MAG: hypothetical protein SFU56_00005 [Capsulimonadales bacterium]|nr:hypothetical protein [Capsulimonadales bacterium]
MSTLFSLVTLRRAFFVSIATIAIFRPTVALAQEAEPTDKVAPRPLRTLYVNGFRAPSIGLEYRENAFSVHSGFYTTILSKTDSKEKRSTNFIKTGVTYYFAGNRAREMYLSVAHVRGLTDGWKKDGAFFEYGTRWQIGKRLEFRLGAGVLAVPGRSARLNPTPGLSFALPLN